MRLTSEVLKIDPEQVAHKITAFIRDIYTRMNRIGIVVPISGGLDSSVVAALCVQAVGNEKVTGIILPEREGNPEAIKYAKLMADILKIKTTTIDITPILSKMGVYRFILSAVPGRKLKSVAVKTFMNSESRNTYVDTVLGSDNPLFRQGYASMVVKHRVRLAVTYKYAEENGLMLVGSAHKSEDMLGLFVKFGIDDLADVMPLKNLFRSHILQLAEALKIPELITGRTPNPDIIPGVEDKYLDTLNIPSPIIDLILFGLESGMSHSDISEQVSLPIEKIAYINMIVEKTLYMRQHSLAPELSVIQGICTTAQALNS